jgi:adenylate cyclase
LLKKKLLVGRRRDSCDIAIEFPNVSSRHCELELQDGYWLVRDLNSSNGTKVNGIRVRAKWILPGDELAVARHRYKIEYHVAPGASPPPPLEEGADENILGTSLLEKAGLVQRRPQRAPAPPKPRAGRDDSAPRTDDDRALEWLEADDDD